MVCCVQYDVRVSVISGCVITSTLYFDSETFKYLLLNLLLREEEEDADSELRRNSVLFRGVSLNVVSELFVCVRGYGTTH